MPSFSNFTSMRKYIEKQTVNALKDDVGRTVKEALQKHVLDKIYNIGGSSEYYQRTYELLRSIMISDVIKTQNGYRVEVYFDNSFTHISWWGSENLGINAGEQVSMSTIATWLNDGSNYFAPHTEGFMEDAIDELEQTRRYFDKFVGYLKSKGINMV